MINILLLAAGTNANFHIARTLKTKFKADCFKIIGADINDLEFITTSIYLNKFYKVKTVADSGYYEQIIGICDQEKVDVIIPSLDADQFLFYPENPDLIRRNIKSTGVSKVLFDIYKSKIKMNSFLYDNGIPVPNLYENTSDDEKFIVKPINGYGSIGVLVKSKQWIIKNYSIIKDNFIIQEKCQGPEVTVEAFTYKQFKTFIARERVATKSGVCTKARFFYDQNLYLITKKIAELFNICPIMFNVQYMKNKQDEWVVIDVNLRPAGGMSMAAKIGWDSISALGNILLGKDIQIESLFTSLKESKIVVRAYEDIITK